MREVVGFRCLGPSAATASLAPLWPSAAALAEAMRSPSTGRSERDIAAGEAREVERRPPRAGAPLWPRTPGPKRSKPAKRSASPRSLPSPPKTSHSISVNTRAWRSTYRRPRRSV